MKDLLYAIVEDLVEDKDSIKITEDAPNEEGVIVLHLNVAPDDMGRVIGKQGRIAKATVLLCVRALQEAILRLQLKLTDIKSCITFKA